MKRFRRWFTTRWQLIADALESFGDLPDDFLD